MARGINKVIIVGTVGNDPETRAFPDGGTVTNISLATNESWTDKQGQKQERTEWHRVVLRDRGNFKLGQIAAQYVRKGSKLYIEGKLQTRSYEKEGQKFYVTEIIANEMQMLDSRNENGGAYAQPQAQPQAQRPQQSTQAAPTSQQPAQSYQSQPVPPGNFDDFDDDIPF
jgi:single-strand DNA-binding protein